MNIQISYGRRMNLKSAKRSKEINKKLNTSKSRTGNENLSEEYQPKTKEDCGIGNFW